MKLRTATLWTTGLLWIAVGLAYWRVFPEAIIGFLYLNSSVLIVNFAFALTIKRHTPQIFLLAATLIYGIWSFFLLVDWMLNPDPFSALGTILGGIISLPVMIPLWITASFLEGRQRD